MIRLCKPWSGQAAEAATPQDAFMGRTPASFSSITAGTVLAVALLTACSSSTGRERVKTGINEWQVDGNVLQLGVNSCNSDPEASFVETEVDVTVTVTALAPPSDGVQDLCGDAVAVTLAAPLGDRAVIDESTGREVDPLPGPG
ncbi:hypothetical protein FHR75_003953 [Kineococcus radiotolerans]|uniref:Uncharacterized protein n=1 Tax=Kineococcus radiotolerans TaxID=131568 RepID=A0A7W4TQ86_KINRA|nr:hypothetical protein [Kineococcus radiotolerans]MBB2903111.1 hypothetical protein [Kineococcus radiotolerans]